jgi:transcriptional regulator with PAS, ATPase and Fis domain
MILGASLGHDGKPVAMNMPTEETAEVRRPVIQVDKPSRQGVTQDKGIELTFTNKEGQTFTASQVKRAVADADGNQRIAAESLGIPRGTIWGWLQKISSKPTE